MNPNLENPQGPLTLDTQRKFHEGYLGWGRGENAENLSFSDLFPAH